jgi:hypothetical protein
MVEVCPWPKNVFDRRTLIHKRWAVNIFILSVEVPVDSVVPYPFPLVEVCPEPDVLLDYQGLG